MRSPQRSDRWIGPVLLFLLVIAVVWGRAVASEFVFWDDGQLIYENPHVVLPGVSTLLGAWKGHHAGMFIPVVYNLWWGIAQVSRLVGGPHAEHGVAPWAFHLANLLVHLICTCLVWGLLRRVGLPKWPAILGALVFAVHPLQAEPVCWSTGMKDLLSTALALGSISLCLRASANWKDDPRTGHLYYCGALLLAFVGSLAKPGILGVPLIAFALDAAFVAGVTRITVLRAAGLAAVLAPSVFWTSLAQPALYDRGVGLLFRPTVALHALGFYLEKLFVPSRLCIDYGLRPLMVVTHWSQVALGLLVPLALLLILLARNHRKPLLVAAVVFVAGVFPVLGLVPFGFQLWSTVSDRYVYMAMLGPAMAAAYLFSLLRPRVCALASVAVLCGFGWISIQQARVWHDTISLMDNTIRINKASAVAYNNFAAAFCPTPAMDAAIQSSSTTQPVAGPLSPEQKAEIVELADQYFAKSFSIRPEYPDPLKNMIWNRAGRGRYREAIALSEMALRLGQNDVFRYVVSPYCLGWLYVQVGEHQKAVEMLSIALYLEPGNEQAHQALIDEIGHIGSPSTSPAMPATSP